MSTPSYRVQLTLALAAAMSNPGIKKLYEKKAEVLAKLDVVEGNLYAERAKIVTHYIRPGDDPVVKRCRAIEADIGKVLDELDAVERDLYALLQDSIEDSAKILGIVDNFKAS